MTCSYNFKWTPIGLDELTIYNYAASKKKIWLHYKEYSRDTVLTAVYEGKVKPFG